MIKILIIGNSFSGKTSVVNRFVANKFEDNYKASTTHFVNAIKTNLKGILVEALHGIKIKDITNLEQLHINEDILKKLEDKVFIADDVQNSDWQISVLRH